MTFAQWFVAGLATIGAAVILILTMGALAWVFITDQMIEQMEAEHYARDRNPL